jgi:beta-glucosidase
MAQTVRFPDRFLFGAATSATQIEGHCPTSDWSVFARQPGRIKHDDRPDVACDSWRRWREDVALLKDLGLGAYRLSIEWARIEPSDGTFDRTALDTYREQLGALRDAGVEPMVTLHHFTLPQWLARRGGLLAPEFVPRFARFTRAAVDALGDLCTLWVTVNEPNVLAAHAYLLGVWPPATRSPVAALRAGYRLLEAHVAAYRVLKEACGDRAQVGIAHHLRLTQPARPDSLGDRAAAATFGAVFNDSFAAAVCEGPGSALVDDLIARSTGFHVADARGTQDFFGINYYSRDVVRLSTRHAGEMFIARGVPPGADVSDLGWEIYPEGLGAVVREWARRSGLPVHITENGIADATDAKRGSFLVRHLAEVARCIDDGVDVRGYFHWSLLDNFEWAEGYSPRFGLCAVDYATLERTVRESGRLYERIARERVLQI